ncbi:MAG: hypothetical protein Q9174_003360 [Haloplaca sp. 1 TL-2023]
MTMNHDELVENCLPLFKADEEIPIEAVEAFVKNNTSLTAKSLETETLKICHECSAMIKEVQAKEARPPRPTPAPPSIRVEPPQAEAAGQSAIPDLSGLSVSGPSIPATSITPMAMTTISRAGPVPSITPQQSAQGLSTTPQQSAPGLSTTPRQSAPGPSTIPQPAVNTTTTAASSSSAPRSTFNWNLNAPYFVPSEPARRAMYSQRLAALNADIARQDSKIQFHKNIVKYGKAAMSDPGFGSLPEKILRHVMESGLDPTQGEGKRLMDWVNENEKSVFDVEKMIEEHQEEFHKAIAKREELSCSERDLIHTEMPEILLLENIEQNQWSKIQAVLWVRERTTTTMGKTERAKRQHGDLGRALPPGRKCDDHDVCVRPTDDDGE